MPSCWEYHAVRDLGSRARRKTPPMPVTRAMCRTPLESLSCFEELSVVRCHFSAFGGRSIGRRWLVSDVEFGGFGVELFGGTVFAACVGYGSDEPLAVGANEVEEIGAAVIDLAVDEEVEGCPDYGQVVVDADERVVNALFDLRGRLGGAGAADSAGEVVAGHLAGFAVAHEDEDCSGEQGFFDGSGVAVGHAGEHGVD